VLPIRDSNPTRRTPVLTLGLIAVNTAVFLYQLSRPDNGSNLVDSQQAVICKFGVVPEALLHNANVGDACVRLNEDQSPLLSLLTSQFLHASWMHLAGNMLFLWIFGNNIEDRLGRIRFLPFYLVGGVLAGLAQSAITPHSAEPLIGASGAIAAVLGGYLLLWPKAKILTLFGWIPIPLPAFVVIGGWIVLQVVYLGGQSSAGDSVAYWAHIGGFVAGLALIKVFLVGREEPPPPPDLLTRLAST
jgi:membrane associated rhomboid family serine protease